MTKIVWKHTTIIIPAAMAAEARDIGAALAPAGAGMYTTGLSPTGRLPATHFVSSGMVDELMVPLLAAAPYLHSAASQGASAQNIKYTRVEADAKNLVDRAVVSHGDAVVLIAQLGLKIVDTDLPPL